MTRTPCSDKNGLKKGTWTPEEDKKLIAYVTRYGFWNWRLLPKFAGLARCGKSCRLRWMNYLRPDIKRGNYSKEEEETIIRLHEKLGNRWSAIASHLPGRTDNEIKNYWHTTLKKRLPQNSATSEKPKSKNHSPAESRQETSQSAPATDLQITDISSPLSPQSSSSCITADTVAAGNENLFLEDEFAFLDTDFWTEPYVADISYVTTSEEAFAYLVTEPEYADPVCDATEIWSHGALYEEYTGLF